MMSPILSPAYSHHILYWQISTLVGFCHGGNVLGNHGNDGNDNYDDDDDNDNYDDGNDDDDDGDEHCTKEEKAWK